ncbi:MAG TPA: peptidase S8 [Balneola sp.]|jgi:subtilisin family serine protease|nr:peptidase S8 [Balneola sp.]MAO78595.1 peptidase S8 [Balneola sp.]MBF63176.1 peptidase S8 [Balneola sp.]HAW81854.1 peptidase S8 [Balneola sp.]HBZ39947.1 peptidase S8 [Balneola sp.]|tara:strand:- start:13955 stop:15169 length:1215 start_codon:yes stop_codon:yes gene_type:complete
MKKYLLRGLVFGVLTIVAVIGCTDSTSIIPETEENISEPSPIPGQYIVVLKGSEKNKIIPGQVSQIESVRNEIIARNNLSLDKVKDTYSHALPGFVAELDDEQLERLQRDENVSYIEQDRMITFAPPCGTPKGGPCDGGGGGGGGSDSQETPYGITRVNGGVTYTGNGVAWILDSGIDLDHPDLNVDASRGYNAFTSGKDGKSLDDGNGHGTHVAGTIAAIDNTEGVIGVAAGATVIPVKVLGARGSGSYSGVIAGINHVAANGSSGDVANMSLGGPVSQAVDDAVKNAAQSSGVKFVLAAGNESDDANNHSPARVNGNNIYTISAMNSNDSWASFSNYGNPPIDYAAPGVSIKSTWKNGSYNTISGTSMAAPHAAGVLLLGNPSTNGTVSGDPDGNADPIIVH